MLTFPNFLLPLGDPLEMQHKFMKNKNTTTDLNFIISEVEFLYTIDKSIKICGIYTSDI